MTSLRGRAAEAGRKWFRSVLGNAVPRLRGINEVIFKRVCGLYVA